MRFWVSNENYSLGRGRPVPSARVQPEPGVAQPGWRRPSRICRADLPTQSHLQIAPMPAEAPIPHTRPAPMLVACLDSHRPPSASACRGPYGLHANARNAGKPAACRPEAHHRHVAPWWRSSYLLAHAGRNTEVANCDRAQSCRLPEAHAHYRRWNSARPSPFLRRIGVHIFTFEAGSSFTRVTACLVARPPFLGFIARLRPNRFPGSDARKLPRWGALRNAGQLPPAEAWRPPLPPDKCTDSRDR
jgi:hypothetical protein